MFIPNTREGVCVKIRIPHAPPRLLPFQDGSEGDAAGLQPCDYSPSVAEEADVLCRRWATAKAWPSLQGCCSCTCLKSTLSGGA
jgi:hypothetical protein